jgi:hypothetical protein
MLYNHRVVEETSLSDRPGGCASGPHDAQHALMTDLEAGATPRAGNRLAQTALLCSRGWSWTGCNMSIDDFIDIG